MRVYKMYASAVATDAVAQVDVRQSGKIMGILLCMKCGDLSDNSYGYAEISYQNKSQRTTNDGVGLLAVLEVGMQYISSGALQEGTSIFIPLPGIPIKQADRLFINTSAGSSNVITVHALLYVKEN